MSIFHLEPGRFYKFEIFAQVNGNKTEGDPNGTTVYTSKYIKLGYFFSCALFLNAQYGVKSNRMS